MRTIESWLQGRPNMPAFSSAGGPTTDLPDATLGRVEDLTNRRDREAGDPKQAADEGIPTPGAGGCRRSST